MNNLLLFTELLWQFEFSSFERWNHISQIPRRTEPGTQEVLQYTLAPLSQLTKTRAIIHLINNQSRSVHFFPRVLLYLSSNLSFLILLLPYAPKNFVRIWECLFPCHSIPIIQHGPWNRVVIHKYFLNVDSVKRSFSFIEVNFSIVGNYVN